MIKAESKKTSSLLLALTRDFWLHLAFNHRQAQGLYLFDSLILLKYMITSRYSFAFRATTKIRSDTTT